MMSKQFYCKDCHFYKDKNPFELESNGKFYPCTNIMVDGWDYWDENQKEPEHCSAYCKRGEYVPTGIWADMAKIVKAVADEIEREEMNCDELKVFRCLANAKISTYMSMYGPSRAVISSKYIAISCGLSIYKTRKIIKSLVDKGLIERVSCSRPAVVSYGEIVELVCEAMPPINGFALTKKAFETEEWKEMYENWKKSLAEWANE